MELFRRQKKFKEAYRKDVINNAIRVSRKYQQIECTESLDTENREIMNEIDYNCKRLQQAIKNSESAENTLVFVSRLLLILRYADEELCGEVTLAFYENEKISLFEELLLHYINHAALVSSVCWINLLLFQNLECNKAFAKGDFFGLYLRALRIHKTDEEVVKNIIWATANLFFDNSQIREAAESSGLTEAIFDEIAKLLYGTPIKDLQKIEISLYFLNQYFKLEKNLKIEYLHPYLELAMNSAVFEIEQTKDFHSWDTLEFVEWVVNASLPKARSIACVQPCFQTFFRTLFEHKYKSSSLKDNYDPYLLLYAIFQREKLKDYFTFLKDVDLSEIWDWMLKNEKNYEIQVSLLKFFNVLVQTFPNQSNTKNLMSKSFSQTVAQLGQKVFKNGKYLTVVLTFLKLFLKLAVTSEIEQFLFVDDYKNIRFIYKAVFSFDISQYKQDSLDIIQLLFEFAVFQPSYFSEDRNFAVNVFLKEKGCFDILEECAADAENPASDVAIELLDKYFEYD